MIISKWKIILLIASIWCVLLNPTYSQGGIEATSKAPIERNHTIILLNLRGHAYEGGGRIKLIELFDRMVKKICLEPQDILNKRPLIGDNDYYSFIGHGLAKGSNLDNLIDTTDLFFTNRQGNAAASLNEIVKKLDDGYPLKNFSYPGLEFARTEALVKNGPTPTPVAHTYVIWIGKGLETLENADKAYDEKSLQVDRITGLATVDERRRKLKTIYSFSEIMNEETFLKHTFNDYGANLWVKVYEVLPANLHALTPLSYLEINNKEDFYLTKQDGKPGWKCNFTINKKASQSFSPSFVQGILTDNQENKPIGVAANPEDLQKDEFELSFFHPGSLKNPRVEIQCWVTILDGFYNSLVLAPNEVNKNASTIALNVKKSKLTSILISEKQAESLYLATPWVKSQKIHAVVFSIIGIILILFLAFLLWRYVISFFIAYFS